MTWNLESYGWTRWSNVWTRRDEWCIQSTNGSRCLLKRWRSRSRYEQKSSRDFYLQNLRFILELAGLAEEEFGMESNAMFNDLHAPSVPVHSLDAGQTGTTTKVCFSFEIIFFLFYENPFFYLKRMVSWLMNSVYPNYLPQACEINQPIDSVFFFFCINILFLLILCFVNLLHK